MGKGSRSAVKLYAVTGQLQGCLRCTDLMPCAGGIFFSSARQARLYPHRQRLLVHRRFDEGRAVSVIELASSGQKVSQPDKLHMDWEERAGRRLSAPGRNRTSDLRFRKPSLYPLSYEGKSFQRPVLRDSTGQRKCRLPGYGFDTDFRQKVHGILCLYQRIGPLSKQKKQVPRVHGSCLW